MTPETNDLDTERVGKIAAAFLSAKEYVLKAGYGFEIDWQESIRLSEVTEQYFLRESAWVILCTGMREAIIRRLFEPISDAFLQWRSAEEISHSSIKCRNNALKLFRHPKKMDAILNITSYVAVNGITCIKERVSQEGPKFLQQFPFIGPVTSKHLAKNLGVCVAKPDRHLVRIASALDYRSIDTLCNDIAGVTQQPVHVVDLVLWRFATLKSDYTTFFRSWMGSNQTNVNPMG